MGGGRGWVSGERIYFYFKNGEAPHFSISDRIYEGLDEGGGGLEFSNQ